MRAAMLGIHTVVAKTPFPFIANSTTPVAWVCKEKASVTKLALFKSRCGVRRSICPAGAGGLVDLRA